MSIVSHTGGRFVPPTRARTDHLLAACTLPPAMTARPRLMARSPAASRQALSRVAVLCRNRSQDFLSILVYP